MILFFWICKCAWFLSKPLETSQNNLGIMLLCTINDDRSFFNSTPFSFLSLCRHLHSKNKWQLKTTNKKRQTQCWTKFISSQEEDFDTYNKPLCFCTSHGWWMTYFWLLVKGEMYGHVDVSFCFVNGPKNNFLLILYTQMLPHVHGEMAHAQGWSTIFKS